MIEIQVERQIPDDDTTTIYILVYKYQYKNSLHISRYPHGHGAAVVDTLRDVARYPCDFTGTAPSATLSITVHGPNDCHRVPLSPYNASWQHFHGKLCDCCTAIARPPTDARV